ncbi:MAG: phosphate ABC transporter permease subunit PstC [Planctomycetaceae bacterium]
MPTATEAADPQPAVSGGSLARRFSLARVREALIQACLFLCASLSVFTTLGIIIVLLSESVISLSADDPAFFQQVSLTAFLTGTEWAWNEAKFGILPLLCGTFLVAGIAALIGLPVGILSAVSMSEYAAPRVRAVLKPVLEILAGIPTVVYGYFALIFVTPYLLKPVFETLFGFDVGVFNAASAGIVVGIMIVPMVSSLSEDALRAVPRSLREAGYALGSTKFDVSVRVVLPAAFSGIMASFLLAIARAVGETMAVAIAAGNTPSLTLNPFEPIQSMTAYIVQVSQGDTPAGTIEYKSLYAVGLSLFGVTLAMNIVSQRIMRRYREVYQ